MTERARYTPARDAAGAAVADEVAEQVQWALPNEPTGALARADLASYVRPEDYPADAQINGESGRVEFEADISPQGRVVNCRVMRRTRRDADLGPPIIDPRPLRAGARRRGPRAGHDPLSINWGIPRSIRRTVFASSAPLDERGLAMQFVAAHRCRAVVSQRQAGAAGAGSSGIFRGRWPDAFSYRDGEAEIGAFLGEWRWGGTAASARPRLQLWRGWRKAG